MLYLIGTGLYNETDISLKGLNACKNSDKIYFEKYTSEIDFNIPNFEKLVNKKIIQLSRHEVETEKPYLKEAKHKTISLLIPGDPLSATTHTEIIQECRKQNIPYEIIHSSSIFTAIAETGLSLYRFGRVVSLPTPTPDFFPLTPIDYIKTNIENNLHTLLLLDIQMTIPEALKILEKLEQKTKYPLPEKIIACSHLGHNSEIYYGTKTQLQKINYHSLPHCIIIPSKLEFYEQEFLDFFKISD